MEMLDDGFGAGGSGEKKMSDAAVKDRGDNVDFSAFKLDTEDDALDSKALVPLETRIQAMIETHDTQADRDYRDLQKSMAAIRSETSNIHDRNNELFGTALSVSRQYEQLGRQTSSTGLIASILTAIRSMNPAKLVRKKEVQPFIERQAGMSQQITELEKRFSVALDEITKDTQKLIATRSRVEAYMRGLGQEILDQKDMSSEIAVEIRSLEQFVDQYGGPDGDADLPEVIEANALLTHYRQSIVRLDRGILDKQTAMANSTMTLNNINEDIDANSEQIDSIKATRRNLLAMMDNVSVAQSEERRFQRARANHKTQDAINHTLMEQEKLRASRAGRIAAQLERPSYDIEMLEKRHEIRQQAESERADIRLNAAKARKEARVTLNRIMAAESKKSTSKVVIGNRNMMLDGKKDETETD